MLSKSNIIDFLKSNSFSGDSTDPDNQKRALHEAVLFVQTRNGLTYNRFLFIEGIIDDYFNGF